MVAPSCRLSVFLCTPARCCCVLLYRVGLCVVRSLTAGSRLGATNGSADASQWLFPWKASLLFLSFKERYNLPEYRVPYRHSSDVVSLPWNVADNAFSSRNA